MPVRVKIGTDRIKNATVDGRVPILKIFTHRVVTEKLHFLENYPHTI